MYLKTWDDIDLSSPPSPRLRRGSACASLRRSRPRHWGRHEQEARHVAVAGDRSLFRERRRVEQIDRVPGRVNVDHLAVAADAHTHARPALERHAAHHAVVLEIERPELVVLDALEHAVAAFAVRCNGEAEATRRPD